MTKVKNNQEVVELQNIEVEVSDSIEVKDEVVETTTVQIKDTKCDDGCCDEPHNHSDEEELITSINPEVSIKSIFNDILTIPQLDIIELTEKPSILPNNQIYTRTMKLINELSETLISYAEQLNPSFDTPYSADLMFHNVPKLCLYNVLQGISEIIKGCRLLSIIDNKTIESLLNEIEYIDDYLVLDEDNYELLKTITSDIMLALANHLDVQILTLENIKFLTKDLTTIMTINNLCITIDNYLEYLSCACFTLDKSSNLSVMNMINDQEFNETDYVEAQVDEMMDEVTVLLTLPKILSSIQLNLVKEYINIINERFETDACIEYNYRFNPPFKTAIDDNTELFIQYFPEVKEYHVIISHI